MSNEERVQIFESKIEEYYLAVMGLGDPFYRSYFEEWPIRKFSIYKLFNDLKGQLDPTLHRALADKLIDVKLHYSYLDTTDCRFYRGATLIVGNNEIEKLNPNTIALLCEAHYKVYLIAVLAEQALDLLELILTSKTTDPKSDKWGKRINMIRERTGDAILTEMEGEQLLNFRDQYRTAEFHKYSTVRAFTSKNEWNHFKTEIDLLKQVLARLARYVTGG